MSNPPPPLTEDVDRFLVERIRGGDSRAWKQLIERYEGRLAAFARSRLGGAADVEDVVQDAFMGFLTSLKHFDESRSLETYLFSIMRYKLGEALSRRQRTPDAARGFDFDDEEPITALAVDSDTPSRIAARQELTAQQDALLASILRRLIEELRDRDKLDDVQVIELLFYVGLRNKEAGDRLGRDEKAIAGVKFRALTRLREYLDEVRATAGTERVLDAEQLSAEATIARVWRTHRLTCLKRNTLGAYLLGVLDEPWQGFTEFHLDTVGCLMCRANRDDLARPAAEAEGGTLQEQIFQSSIGFLSRASGA